jgi:hypothetical protein
LVKTYLHIHVRERMSTLVSNETLFL